MDCCSRLRPAISLLEFLHVRRYCGRGHHQFFRRTRMAATKITPAHNGPLRVEGEFEIVDPEGKSFGLAGRTRISLCRCGHSANKPFYDWTHTTVGFHDEVHAPHLPPPTPNPPLYRST